MSMVLHLYYWSDVRALASYASGCCFALAGSKEEAARRCVLAAFESGSCRCCPDIGEDLSADDVEEHEMYLELMRIEPLITNAPVGVAIPGSD